MTGKYIGQAKRSMHGNDLFWEYTGLAHDDDGNLVMGDDGRLVWLSLRWTGYNDSAWWTKWYKDCELCRGDNGKTYRIDFTNCNVYEVVE